MEYRQVVVQVINFKFYSYGTIAIKMAHYIYLFNMIQPGAKSIYENKNIIKTKVPFEVIHNI